MSKKYQQSGVDTSLISSLKFIMESWKSCYPMDAHTKSTFEWMTNYIKCLEAGTPTKSVPNVPQEADLKIAQIKQFTENHLVSELGVSMKQAVSN